jgi:hypothetical protein
LRGVRVGCSGLLAVVDVGEVSSGYLRRRFHAASDPTRQ